MSRKTTPQGSRETKVMFYSYDGHIVDNDWNWSSAVSGREKLDLMDGELVNKANRSRCSPIDVVCLLQTGVTKLLQVAQPRRVRGARAGVSFATKQGMTVDRQSNFELIFRPTFI